MSRDFSAATDKIDAGSATAIDDLGAAAFTAFAWIRPDSTGASGTGRIFDKRPSNQLGGWIFYADVTNSLGFGTVDSGGSILANQRGADSAITLDVWNAVAVTYDDAGDRRGNIYVGGSEISYDADDAGASSPATDASGSLFIGNNSNDNRNFDGEIEWGAIWDVVLSANELQSLADGICPLYIRPQNLVRCFPLWGTHSPEIDLSNNSSVLSAVTGTTRGAGSAPVMWSMPVTQTLDITAVSNWGKANPIIGPFGGPLSGPIGF